jgi:hypothetical protein
MTMTTAEELTQRIDRIREALLQEDLDQDVLTALESDLESMEKHLDEGDDDGLHSVLELRGLGKEIWQDIDVDEYIRQERASWR